MVLTLTDREIDRRINNAVIGLRNKYNIKVSKTDIIRKLININKQGKKTNRIWKKINPDELRKWF